MLPDLNDKNMNVETMAKEALKDKKILSELLANLKTKNETVRYNSSKVLNLLSEKNPEVLYPQWDYFVELLSSDHTYWKLSVIPLLANLTRIDTENKFERIFEKFSQVGLRREGQKTGTGLGLAFCRMAAQALGGKISVESTPGKGSRFSLLLPEAPRAE